MLKHEVVERLPFNTTVAGDVHLHKRNTSAQFYTLTSTADLNNHRLKITGLIEQLLHVTPLVILACRFFQRGEELIKAHRVRRDPVTCSDAAVGFGSHRTLPEERLHQWPQMTLLQRLQETHTPASKTKDLMEQRGKIWCEINMYAQSSSKWWLPWNPWRKRETEGVQK